MIAHIKGILTEKFDNSVIIDVNGVGYEVALSAIDYDQLSLDDEVKLYTYHLVREQSEELFGFTSLAAKKLFELLISVQGVGPKAGMAILSLAPAEEVRNAIANADSAYISKASGVGKKSAERIGDVRAAFVQAHFQYLLGTAFVPVFRIIRFYKKILITFIF